MLIVTVLKSDQEAIGFIILETSVCLIYLSNRIDLIFLIILLAYIKVNTNQ